MTPFVYGWKTMTCSVAGLCYLTETDLTSIFECYYNGGRYGEEERTRFYQQVADAFLQAG